MCYTDCSQGVNDYKEVVFINVSNYEELKNQKQILEAFYEDDLRRQSGKLANEFAEKNIASKVRLIHWSKIYI